jgi:predicted  nucleic acid-binding Zn-ribbon protein
MPEMREQLERLYELQQTDSGIAARAKALRELDDGTGADNALTKARQDLEAKEKALHALQAAMKDRELALKSAEDEKKQRSKQAYGGTIADPKQLSALEKKIAELGRTQDRLESEILELMDKVEAAEKELAAAKQAAEAAQQKAGATHQAYAGDTERLRGELADLKARRQELADGLDRPLLAQYESLLPKTAGVAVVAVRKGACTGCKVSVPGAFAPRLQNADRVVQCENCRRILFLPHGESPFKPAED